MPLYYDTLPANHKEIYRFDATSKSMTRKLVVLSLLLFILPVILGMIPVLRLILFSEYSWYFTLELLIYGVLYLPVHELLHGLVYRHYTGKSFEIGFQAPIYLYCNTKGYVHKKVFLRSMLAPVTVMSIVYFIGMALSIYRQNGAMYMMSLLLQANNLSGAAGDLYTYWLLRKTIPQTDYYAMDMGATQIIYEVQ